MFNSLKREIQILTDIKGIPNVVELMDVFWDTQSVGLLFPYYSNGDLLKYYTLDKYGTTSREEKAKRIVK